MQVEVIDNLTLERPGESAMLDFSLRWAFSASNMHGSMQCIITCISNLSIPNCREENVGAFDVQVDYACTSTPDPVLG